MIGILILAGGRGQRMGGQDKGWCHYQQRPMIKTVLANLQTQMTHLTQAVCVISANRTLLAYQQLGVAVVSDVHAGFNGPLAGVEAALLWQAAQRADHSSKYTSKNATKHKPITRWITCPVDSMALPGDYLQRMANLPNDRFGFAQQTDAHNPNYAHMTFPSQLSNGKTALNSLQTYLYGEGLTTAARARSIRGWLNQQNARAITFTQPNAFLNINAL